MRREMGVGTGSIRHWVVMGPLAPKRKGAWDWTVHPPEKRVDLAGTVPGRDGPVRWEAVRGTPNSLALGRRYGEQKPAVAYALTAIRASEAVTVEVSVKTQSGVQVWHNGDVVLLAPEPAGRRSRTRAGTCTLAKGLNVLMFKMVHQRGPWTLEARVLPKGDKARLQILDPGALLKMKAVPAPGAPLPPGMRAAFPPAVRGLRWKPVFEDDFQRKELGPDWRTLRGTWRLEGGMACADGVAWLAYTKPVARPVKITYHAVSTQPCDLSCFLARGRSPMAGYMLGFGANGNALNKLLRQGTPVAESSRYLIRPGRLHQVEAVFTDTYVGMTVDGRMVLERREPNPVKGLDTIGLYTWKSGRFDHVTVSAAARP